MTDLITAIEHIYEPAGLTLTDNARREEDSVEYGACRFGLDGKVIVFRVAKTTPTKLGQFVTLWKRATPTREIAPLDSGDGIAFVVINVADETHRGQFVFDRQILAARSIMSIEGKGGKRAFRVYPPWSRPVAKQAIKTQEWQLRYFLALDQCGYADPVQVRRLFRANTPDTVEALA
jgi:hypothetical protein